MDEAQLQQLADQGISSSQDKNIKERLAIATKIMEQYYGKKQANSILLGKELQNTRSSASKIWTTIAQALKLRKHQLKIKDGIFDPEFEMEHCKLAVSAQCASAAALHAMVLEDYKSVTMWTLYAHHIAQIITEVNQARREIALTSEQLKGKLNSEISALDVLEDESNKKIKDFAKTQKILADQRKQATIQTPVAPIPQQIIQTPPQQASTAAQIQTSILQQPFFQQLPLQQLTPGYQLPSNQLVSSNPSKYSFFPYGRAQKRNKRGELIRDEYSYQKHFE
ncbi:MAG: hypothetical protein EZS28_033874 [Streblomastix strix]|uniref:Uncharacterized protein n=1 Tax=Streblomastix strix TaxID=222440 RepID=A0A5J4UKM2_9EUKA|nr:MAG: hypothetical protein EZS28_033874 [Streblomastix strix]